MLVVLVGPYVSQFGSLDRLFSCWFLLSSFSLLPSPPLLSGHNSFYLPAGMAIQQHSEAVGTPVRISVTGAVVAILISDAQPRDRPPRPKKDASLPEGSINEIFEADEPAKKRWRHAIATYLVHEMDLRPKGTRQFFLGGRSRFLRLSLQWQQGRNSFWTSFQATTSYTCT